MKPTYEELEAQVKQLAAENAALLDALASRDKQIAELEISLKTANDSFSSANQQWSGAIKRIAELEARPEQQPVAWRYRNLMPHMKNADGSSGWMMPWKYVDTKGECNHSPGYCHEPLFSAAPAAQPVTVKLPDSGLGEFERGVFYSAYLVCELHDDPTIAADVLREANLDGSDVSSLDDCEKEVLLKLNASEKISLTAAGITIAEGE